MSCGEKSKAVSFSMVCCVLASISDAVASLDLGWGTRHLECAVSPKFGRCVVAATISGTRLLVSHPAASNVVSLLENRRECPLISVIIDAERRVSHWRSVKRACCVTLGA